MLTTATQTSIDAKLGHAHIIDSGVNVANLDHFSSVSVPNNAILSTDPNHVLETIFDPITPSNENLQAHLMSLQLQDTIQDIQDPDWSFVPCVVIDHKISNEPRCKVVHTASVDPSQEPEPVLSLDDKPHLRLKVLWMNGEISWVSADPLQLQNPWVIAQYANNNGLLNHSHFKWAKDYLFTKVKQQAMDASVNILSQVLATKSHHEMKYKFGA